MALSSTQQASRLFKKSLGIAETTLSRDFFEEPRLGRSSILPIQIWSQGDIIPTTAPVLSDQQISGVVKYYNKLTLTHDSNKSYNSFYSDELKDCIPFNYGGGYGYKLYKSNDVEIPFGSGDWLVDTEAGVLTFYGTLPSDVSDTLLPKISFYKYVGTKGLSVMNTSLSTEISERVSVDNSLSTALTSKMNILSFSSYSNVYTYLANLPFDPENPTEHVGQILVVNDNIPYYVSYEDRYYYGGSLVIAGYDEYEGSTTFPGKNSLLETLNGGNQLYVGHYLITFLRTNVADHPELRNSIRLTLKGNNIPGSYSYLVTELNRSSNYYEMFGISQPLYNIGQQFHLGGESLNSLIIIHINGSKVNYTYTTDQAFENEITTNGYIQIGFYDLMYFTGSNMTTKPKSTLSLISTETSSRISADASLSTALSVNLISGISSEISTRTSADASLSVALSDGLSQRLSTDISLSQTISTGLSQRVSTDVSLSQTISTGLSQRVSTDVSLTNQIGLVYDLAVGATQAIVYANYEDLIGDMNGWGKNDISGKIGQSYYIQRLTVPDLWVSYHDDITIPYTYTTDQAFIDAVNSNGGALQIGYYYVSFLETQKVDLTNYVTTQTLSTGLSQRVSTDVSLSQSLSVENSLRLDMNGLGLGYDSNLKLEVLVDDYTITTLNNTLRSTELWVQSDSTTNISNGTGATNITLQHNPVGYVSVYVNGIEYMVSLVAGVSTGCPFYFVNSLPSIGSVLYFSATEAGFGLESGVDLIMVKYQYINML